ncbi:MULTISPECIES: hypothetical protein [unclassified Pseudonocardia]|uniref:hypothetical protein n=1 Tax=unclassified Pseudonocardia TaxID=2619320 RepID=UPI00094B2AE8|nr:MULTISPECIES: hypothetical protein [unclassified Pseudonocardia]OLL70022.1 hypothetical protein Ae150APs1_6110c [Pseudonocardia sp. Ae150A_Ps1]
MTDETTSPKRPGRDRRAHVAGGRPHTVRVRLSTPEYVAVHAAAVRADTSDAAWLGEAGVAAARPAASSPGGPPRGWGESMQALMAARAELAEDRRVLRNVGGNLNDLAQAANSGSGVAAETERVLGLVERAVERIGGLVRYLMGPGRAGPTST